MCGAVPDRHGRRGRLERGAGAAVEAGTAEAVRRDRAGHPGASPAPGAEQVERDRAPAVLVHQPELASNASGELSGDRRPDRGDHDQDRPERALRARPASLPEGGGWVRCRNCRAQHRARRVPWRVELSHLAPPSLTLTGSRSCTYFLTGPKAPHDGAKLPFDLAVTIPRDRL